MKIYTTVAKDLSKALEIACKTHGVNIQVVYEKEILFGLFRKKWVEIGYLEKEVETDPFADEEEKEKVAANPSADKIVSESQRLRSIFYINDFSPSYCDRIISEFINSRVIDKKEYGQKENDEFVLSAIQKTLKDDFDSAANPPDVFVVVSPVPCERKPVLMHIINNFSDSKSRLNAKESVLLNYGTDDTVNLSGKSFDCSDSDSLFEKINENKGKQVIVNLDGKYFGDRAFFRKVSKNCSSNGISWGCYLLIPSYIKCSEMKKFLKGSDEIKSIIFTDIGKDSTMGNMISVSDETGKKILFFDTMDKCRTPGDFNVMEKLVGFSLKY